MEKQVNRSARAEPMVAILWGEACGEREGEEGMDTFRGPEEGHPAMWERQWSTEEIRRGSASFVREAGD